jgi:A24A-like peptidase
MFFNDVHIMIYVAFGILGLIVGNILPHINKRLTEHKKVLTKDFFKDYPKNFKPHYIHMLLIAIIYILLLYKFGLKPDFIQNLDLIKYMILTPMLFSVAVIDFKNSIIPNRLLLTMAETGLLLTFVYGISDINLAMDMLLGMLVGTVIFGILTLLGRLVSGKEAMGMGDVKLVAALGLFFGASNILAISIISFVLGAIISIILILSKKRKIDDYIPFGPFIVIASYIAIFVPFSAILFVLLKIFTLGLYKV